MGRKKANEYVTVVVQLCLVSLLLDEERSYSQEEHSEGPDFDVTSRLQELAPVEGLDLDIGTVFLQCVHDVLGLIRLQESEGWLIDLLVRESHNEDV